MEVKATAKQVGVSSQKLWLVLDQVRGKSVDEALAMLRFSPTPAGRTVAKVVKSAAANAENNFQMAPSNLRIIRIYANKGRTMKRFRPQARGRANPILKRSSHITVVVAEE
jgi:large subunit ribosomal protein L22